MIRSWKISPFLGRDWVVVGASALLLLGATLLAFWLPYRSLSTRLASSGSGRVASNVKDRPLAFEEYPGVTGELNRFLARTVSYSTLLEPSRALVRIVGCDGRTRTVKMHFVGSAENARSDSRQQLPGKVHYLVGNDPALWRTGLSRYRRIVFHDVYPGIDLHYHGAGNRLEYDLVLHSGADPEQILLEFEGADSVSIDSAGSLSLAVGSETLQLLPPKVYQKENQVRTSVPASYELTEDQTVRFRVGKYDRDRDLVIDPVLVYSTTFGGSGSERNALIAVDHNGNAYVAGETGSRNFPLIGSLTDEFGFSQGYITKFDPNGEVIFSTFLGGTRAERIQDVAVDLDSNVYVTGFTQSDDFPLQDAFQNELYT